MINKKDRFQCIGFSGVFVAVIWWLIALIDAQDGGNLANYFFLIVGAKWVFGVAFVWFLVFILFARNAAINTHKK